MASIIIPAHNEAGVIARSIAAVLAQAAPDDEILVCANGCTDDTAEIARTFGPRVRVLTTPRASKVKALNQGDGAAGDFPRIYMDADVELAEGCLDRLKQALTSGPWLATAPEPVMDLGNSSWAVRAYYRIWLSLPYCRQGMIGAGVYALSEAGRRRFGPFPELIADDGYVRALFRETERGRARGARVRVKAPANLYWLLKIKVRSRLGQKQLAQAFPELGANECKAYAGAMAGALRSPLRWPAALVYLYVNLASRLVARRRLRRLSYYRWEKDLSARAPKKVLMVASHGGHWVQMRRLAPAFEGMLLHYVSTTAGVAGEVAPASLSVVRDANLQDKAALIPLAWDLLRIVATTRPDFVVSTGAAPGFFALAFGKLFGARTIWIDSLANAERMSVSGAKVKPFADLWLTQWPHLDAPDGPLFKGAVL